MISMFVAALGFYFLTVSFRMYDKAKDEETAASIGANGLYIVLYSVALHFLGS